MYDASTGGQDWDTALEPVQRVFGARAVVLALTWLAKQKGWDTHYTKFGPSGIERESLGETMFAAGFAQIGFWVPFTILGGMLAATVFGGSWRKLRP